MHTEKRQGHPRVCGGESKQNLVFTGFFFADSRVFLYFRLSRIAFSQPLLYICPNFVFLWFIRQVVSLEYRYCAREIYPMVREKDSLLFS